MYHQETLINPTPGPIFRKTMDGSCLRIYSGDDFGIIFLSFGFQYKTIFNWL